MAGVLCRHELQCWAIQPAHRPAFAVLEAEMVDIVSRLESSPQDIDLKCSAKSALDQLVKSQSVVNMEPVDKYAPYTSPSPLHPAKAIQSAVRVSLTIRHLKLCSHRPGTRALRWLADPRRGRRCPDHCMFPSISARRWVIHAVCDWLAQRHAVSTDSAPMKGDGSALFVTTVRIEAGQESGLSTDV